jgi:Zn ribbon nucleic-acid-binding protein
MSDHIVDANKKVALKACPVCRGNKIAIAYVEKDTHHVQCACGLSSRYIKSNNLDYVRSVWNTRPIEDDLQAKIAKLEQAIQLVIPDDCKPLDVLIPLQERIIELEDMVSLLKTELAENNNTF